MELISYIQCFDKVGWQGIQLSAKVFWGSDQTQSNCSKEVPVNIVALAVQQCNNCICLLYAEFAVC